MRQSRAVAGIDGEGGTNAGKTTREEKEKRRWVKDHSAGSCRRSSWLSSGSNSPSGATEFNLGGKPASLMGYVDQGVTANISREKSFDNKDGLNSAVFTSLLEGEYKPAPNLKVFMSGKLTADLDLPDPEQYNNSEWKGKEFDQSRDELFVDTGWDKMLNEAFVTYSPGNLFVRVGKQIVSWGETDGFRLMDQINPVDSAGAWGTWNSRTPSSRSGSSGRTTTCSPNRAGSRTSDSKPSGTRMPSFRATGPSTWATMSRGSGLRTFRWRPGFNSGLRATPTMRPKIGRGQGMEFGARVKGVVNDMIFSLNYFNGLSNSGQLKSI